MKNKFIFIQQIFCTERVASGTEDSLLYKVGNEFTSFTDYMEIKPQADVMDF